MQDKPEVVKRLERQLKEPLKPMPLDRIMPSTDNGYTLDENRRLVGLNLYKAGLADISFLEDAAFAHLTHLEISKNKVSDIDISSLSGLTGLTYLDLRYNRIAQLPPETLQMGLDFKWKVYGTYGISLKGNPLETPPLEIVKQGTDAVRNYFEDLKKESGSVRI